MGVGGQRLATAALPPGKTRFLLCRRMGGSQSRYGQVRKISSLPGFDPRIVQPVASPYTDHAIPALRAGRSSVQIPVVARNLSLFRNVQIGYGAHLSPYVPGFLPRGEKQPQRDADHSSPTSAAVKNEWSYTSAVPTRLHGADKDPPTLF